MTKKARKAYLKPEITQVKLVPEEAVLGGCKNVAGSGPNTADCGYAGTQCVNMGS